MVPVLLLLLLHESLAQEELCINITNHNMTITRNNVEILEIFYNNESSVECKRNAIPCQFQCFNTMSTNPTWFNESHHCTNASEEYLSEDSYKYTIMQNSTCFLYVCNDSSIVPIMENLKTGELNDLMQMYSLRDSCRDVFDNSSEIKKTFIEVEKQLIHEIMKASKVEVGGSEKHNLTDLYMNVIKQSDSSLNAAAADFLIQTELLPNEDSSVPEIWMPVNALQSIPQENRTICLVSYMQHNQFQLAQEKIMSMVVRIELLGERRLQNLNPPIEMVFKNPPTDIDNGSVLMCHYFDEHDFVWKTDGCQTQNDENNIICYCTHTTPFAVLMIRQPISKVHWEILSYISYIGCGLSAFFTALSIVMYVFSRNHKMDYSISIHVSLSGALFLLNTAFMLAEWGSTVELDWVCEFIAALMHYSLLCCFTWMGIEALHLYLLLIKVFNTYYKHYLLKLSLGGWGIPGVIVATALGLKNYKKFYGKTELEMEGTDQTNKICWITNETFFYSVNLAYFAIIFVFNSGILMAVASNICKMKQVIKNNSKFKAKTEGKSWGGSERFSASCKSGLTLLGLTCLMGITWGLAFLGFGYVNYAILYLFCILNSFQGFFIFLWICLSVKKQRKREEEEKWTSTPMRTSATKSD